MAHHHERRDAAGDLIDVVTFCSDTCHRAWCSDTGNPYMGWNGAHELTHSTTCDSCGECIQGVDDDPDTYDHDTTPTHRPCHGCGATLDESEINWARPDGSLSVDDGDPYCDACLPAERDTTPLGSAERDPRISIAMPRSEWLRMAEVLALMAEDSHEMSRKEARTQADADHLEEQGDWLQAKADEINGAADGGHDAF